MEYGKLWGTWPAVVKSCNHAKRLYTVDIPMLTQGGGFPEAEIKYPIGDKSKHTEIEVLPGDLVWVEFIGGDARYPLITGYRCPRSGNASNWRRWHHANVEIAGDQEIHIKVGGTSLIVNASGIHMTAASGASLSIASGSIGAKAGNIDFQQS